MGQTQFTTNSTTDSLICFTNSFKISFKYEIMQPVKGIHFHIICLVI